jgi:hypothetical protein
VVCGTMERLVLRHTSRVFRLLLRIVCDAATVEDCLLKLCVGADGLKCDRSGCQIGVAGHRLAFDLIGKPYFLS